MEIGSMELAGWMDEELPVYYFILPAHSRFPFVVFVCVSSLSFFLCRARCASLLSLLPATPAAGRAAGDGAFVLRGGALHLDHFLVVVPPQAQTNDNKGSS